MSLAHLKHETKSHMKKIKNKSRVYKECVIKELAKILNTVLSHIHTRAHTCAHEHTRALLTRA